MPFVSVNHTSSWCNNYVCNNLIDRIFKQTNCMIFVTKIHTFFKKSNCNRSLPESCKECFQFYGLHYKFRYIALIPLFYYYESLDLILLFSICLRHMRALPRSVRLAWKKIRRVNKWSMRTARERVYYFLHSRHEFNCCLLLDFEQGTVLCDWA